MDTAHWPQEIAMKPLNEIVVQNDTNSCSKPSSSLERIRARPQKESTVNCRRCNSINTKFCYYNNYSLSQPRFFCKTCRRYWTEGGSLRNVPIGGGSRKNKRSSSSSSNSSISKKLPDLVVPHETTSVPSQNPRMHHDEHGQDLNLGFPSTHDFKTISELIQVPNFDGTKNTMSLSSFMSIAVPDHNSVYSSSGQLMIPMPEFKIPSLNFPLDGMGGIHESSSGRLLFPFQDLKTSTTSTTTHDHGHHHNVAQNRDHNGETNGFWSGMLGGGSW